jgi:hypothetical protein
VHQSDALPILRARVQLNELPIVDLDEYLCDIAAFLKLKSLLKPEFLVEVTRPLKVTNPHGNMRNATQIRYLRPAGMSGYRAERNCNDWPDSPGQRQARGPCHLCLQLRARPNRDEKVRSRLAPNVADAMFLVGGRKPD